MDNKTIYKGNLTRTFQEKIDFASAHSRDNISHIPPFTLMDLMEGVGHLDHDIQINNLEQQLNRMILDYGEDYTIGVVLGLIKNIKR